MDVEVFIGDLKDPEFNYENGDYNGNCPRRISEFFPKSYDLFSEIIDKIESGELDGKQTDWGSWTARLYPNQIIEVVSSYYGDSRDSSIKNLISFINDLPKDEKFGLVACEMP